MNLPNRLTILRMILIPFVLLFMLPLPFMPLTWNYFIYRWGMLLALLFFVAASVTDYLDGHIARSQNIVSNFGKFLDPIADKLLVLSVFMAFIELGRISTWVLVIILFRELLVTGIRLLAAEDQVVVAARMPGKIKTVSQMCAIIFMMLELALNRLLNLPWLGTGLHILGDLALIFSIVMSAYSAWDYCQRNRQVFAKGH